MKHSLRQVAPLALLCALASNTAAAQAPVTFQVPMRDGTKLSTDVYLPAAGAQWPVVLRRTPYGRAVDPQLVRNLAASGLALVSQDTRGRGASEGLFESFRTEGIDGADTIAWVAGQPWSNGKVATWGASAEGMVQLWAAAEAPPALKCAVPSLTTDDLYEHFAFPGGAFRHEVSFWATAMNLSDHIRGWRSHEVADSFWDPVRLTPAERSRIRAPMMLVGGLFDIFAGMGDLHRRLQTESDPAIRESHYLVLGPWTHASPFQLSQGQVTFPANATVDLPDIVQFLDWCLKDGARPSWRPVRHYVFKLSDDGTSADGEWRETGQWPPDAETTRAYLHNDGLLHLDAPGSSSPVQLPVDPAAPLDPPGTRAAFVRPAGPMDQSTTDKSPGVLTATLPAVEEDFEVIGNVEADIWAASSTTDVDVVVRLEQLTPTGQAIFLADGVRRGRFVQGFDAIRPLIPGTPAKFHVSLRAVSFILPKGHALRVAISGTHLKLAEPNPNTAAPLAADPTPTPTTLSIFRDAAHPSSVTFPKLRAGSLVRYGAAVDATGCGCGTASGAAPATLALLFLCQKWGAAGRKRRERTEM